MLQSQNVDNSEINKQSRNFDISQIASLASFD